MILELEAEISAVLPPYEKGGVVMKAAIVHEFKKPLRIEEVEKPVPGQGMVVVKIEASGLCHTDIHAANGDWPVKPKLPFIPGHEGVGIIESVGKGVTERASLRYAGVCEHHQGSARRDPR